MALYNDDRNFTNYVHQHLAVPIIYEPLGWTEKEIDAAQLEFIDINEGVDYVFENEEEYEIKTQERFRDNYYKNYTDCTLRYRRDKNADPTRHESEFYKIKADYLVYGITNGSKFLDKRHTLTDFLKYVVVDLKVLYDKIEQKLIVPKYGAHVSYIKDGVMIVPIKDNTDDSSSFVAFDVKQLNDLFGDENIIIAQKGYF
jgi:hypothetical protein